jgi:hypothetical protein
MSAAPRRRRGAATQSRRDCSLFLARCVCPPSEPAAAACSRRPERTYGSHRWLEEREATVLGLYCVRGGGSAVVTARR